MYSVPEFEQVKRLTETSLSDYAVARATGIPRDTVRRWRLRDDAPGNLRAHVARFSPESYPTTYAYVLGLYLGDGHIWQTGKHSWRLGITLDAKYPGIIAESRSGLEVVFPGLPVCKNERRGTGAVILLVSSPLMLSAFPQHAPGKKHHRAIALADWQRDITVSQPRSFIRGLIHSDGSRCFNRFSMTMKDGSRKPYAYPRYFFTNYSADIRRIFCEHCELLGIRWTQSNPRNISISHRDSVAILDSFVGPKE